MAFPPLYLQRSLASAARLSLGGCATSSQLANAVHHGRFRACHLMKRPGGSRLAEAGKIRRIAEQGITSKVSRPPDTCWQQARLADIP
jgi:hypothetical protein